MKNNDIYQAWKRQRNNMSLSPDFAERVMANIPELKQYRPKPTNPLIKVALTAASLTIAITKTALILYAFLH